MGIFDRLTTLIKSNLNDLISSAENPEKMLNQIIVEIAGDKAFQERNMLNLGLIPILNTPEQFAAYLKAEITKWTAVVRDAGLRGK
mgnify:CR=1 FL=1